jgi:flagellar biosynthesis regulator FlbT
MSTDNDGLALTEQHVRQAKEIVARQRAVVLKLDSLGVDSFGAKQTLEIFETNLRIFEGHRDYLKKQSDKK